MVKEIRRGEQPKITQDIEVFSLVVDRARKIIKKGAMPELTWKAKKPQSGPQTRG